MDAVRLDEVSTYFSHPEQMFPEIENDKVPTEQFLRACQGIADFVGKLGILAFKYCPPTLLRPSYVLNSNFFKKFESFVNIIIRD